MGYDGGGGDEAQRMALGETRNATRGDGFLVGAARRPMGSRGGSVAWKRTALVIGEQKSATTALAALIRSPALLSGESAGHRKFEHSRKELHFFERPELRCVHQPHDCRAALRSRAAVSPEGWIVDATPSYFGDALALVNIYSALPRAKLVLVLRDPISRAASAWKQNLKGGAEPRSFTTAVLDELATLSRRCLSSQENARFAQMVAAPRDAGRWTAAELSTHDAAALYELVIAIAARVNPWSLHAKWTRDEATTWRSAMRHLQMVTRDAAAPLQPIVARVVSRGGGACRPAIAACWLTSQRSTDDCKHYLVRGLAAAKLAEWTRIFGAARLLVLRTEAVLADARGSTKQLAAFFGVPTSVDETKTRAVVDAIIGRDCWHNCNSENASADVGKQIEPHTRALLERWYAADRSALNALCGDGSEKLAAVCRPSA